MIIQVIRMAASSNFDQLVPIFNTSLCIAPDILSVVTLTAICFYCPCAWFYYWYWLINTAMTILTFSTVC